MTSESHRSGLEEYAAPSRELPSFIKNAEIEQEGLLDGVPSLPWSGNDSWGWSDTGQTALGIAALRFPALRRFLTKPGWTGAPGRGISKALRWRPKPGNLSRVNPIHVSGMHASGAPVVNTLKTYFPSLSNAASGGNRLARATTATGRGINHVRRFLDKGLLMPAYNLGMSRAGIYGTLGLGALSQLPNFLSMSKFQDATNKYVGSTEKLEQMIRDAAKGIANRLPTGEFETGAIGTGVGALGGGLAGYAMGGGSGAGALLGAGAGAGLGYYGANEMRPDQKEMNEQQAAAFEEIVQKSILGDQVQYAMENPDFAGHLQPNVE